MLCFEPLTTQGDLVTWPTLDSIPYIVWSSYILWHTGFCSPNRVHKVTMAADWTEPPKYLK